MLWLPIIHKYYGNYTSLFSLNYDTYFPHREVIDYIDNVDYADHLTLATVKGRVYAELHLGLIYSIVDLDYLTGRPWAHRQNLVWLLQNVHNISKHIFAYLWSWANIQNRRFSLSFFLSKSGDSDFPGMPTMLE